ncbi:MAG: GNAT family N-acetyltransferase [Oscillibacter sp.]|nr:GNAT family N-acetyltransferase [Oscillibacter sp.]
MVDLKRIEPLFDGWEETMVWSCLQGVMGRAEANGDYTSGMIVSRDFTFLAGVPDRGLLEKAKGPILVPRTEDWNALIEAVFGEKAVKETRYAIRKEPGVFDRRRLEAFAAALPDGYELRLIDEKLVPVLLSENWSRDFCAAFDSPADCCTRGIGVAAMYEDVPVAGAGSYIVYQGGIEVEIDTREDHRRKGLAAACGARLILECLDRGLYPSWDAIDLRSVSLAEKLGYHRGEPYMTYWIG